mgnify:CR=1 FL=1
MQDIIKQAELDQTIDISVSDRYETVVFHWFTGSDTFGFTWTAIPLRGGTYNGEKHKEWPRKENGRRKAFKTLAGAKKNFLKRISEQGG